MSIQDDVVRKYMEDAFECLGIKPDVRVIDSALNLYKKVSCDTGESVGETNSSELPSVGSSSWGDVVQIKLGGAEFNMSVDSFIKIGYKIFSSGNGNI